MDRSTFWHIIEETKQASGEDLDRHMNLLKARLQLLPLQDIQDFQYHFYDLYFASYQAPLWSAVSLAAGGCSDDWFDYFRGWLIAQGKAVFSQVLSHPDALANLLATEKQRDDDIFCQDIISMAKRVYREKAGEDMPGGRHWTYPRFSEEDRAILGDKHFAREHFPRLWELFEEA
jgi:hypothetical protein